MARKDFYVDYSAFYNGDGSTSAQPISSGEVGCWNDFTDTESIQVSGGDIDSQWFVWFRQETKKFKYIYVFGGSPIQDQPYKWQYNIDSWISLALMPNSSYYCFSGSSDTSIYYNDYSGNRGVWFNIINESYSFFTPPLGARFSSQGDITYCNGLIYPIVYGTIYKANTLSETYIDYMTTAINYSSFTRATTNNINKIYNCMNNDFCENDLNERVSIQYTDIFMHSGDGFCFHDNKMFHFYGTAGEYYDFNIESNITGLNFSGVTNYDNTAHGSTINLDDICFNGGTSNVLEWETYNSYLDVWNSKTDKPNSEISSYSSCQGAYE